MFSDKVHRVARDDGLAPIGKQQDQINVKKNGLGFAGLEIQMQVGARWRVKDRNAARWRPMNDKGIRTC